MGMLYYDHSGPGVLIDDRTLAHLKVVIVTKMRRGESFTLGWEHPDEHGRTTIWIHPSIPVRFTFDEPQRGELNQEWIKQMADSAIGTRGIFLSKEHIEA